ncbi:nuclease-related domain-containing protein [Corallococcus llansteffanensis]|nr:nuclease-related domain-containing protein [Corallococcus llansteffanensis]
MPRRRNEKDVPRAAEFSVRRAGESAREKQNELAKAAPIKTFFTRLFGMNTDERAWGRGAEGEERVGMLLEALRPRGWFIQHDVKIGRNGANVDHLVIGPPGVYVINTKLLQQTVWVAGAVIKVGGYSKDYVEKGEAEAKRIREQLIDATGRRSLWVQSLLVFVDADLVVKHPPRNVPVLRDHELVPSLLEQQVTLGQEEVVALARAAQQVATWR